jgi:hypothetical protein
MSNNVQPFNSQYWSDVVSAYEAKAGEELGVANQESEKILENRRLQPYFGYTWNPFHWGGYSFHTHHHTTVVQTNAPSADDKENEFAKTAMIIGAVVSGAAAFAVGIFYSRTKGYYDAKNNTQEVYDRCKSEIDYYSKSNFENRLDIRDILSKIKVSVLQKRLWIDCNRYERARNDLLASVTLLSGGAALFIGGAYVSSLLMTAGYVTVFAGSVFLLLNQGLHWNDAEPEKFRNREICDPSHGSSSCEGMSHASFIRKQLAQMRSSPESSSFSPSAPSYEGMFQESEFSKFTTSA